MFNTYYDSIPIVIILTIIVCIFLIHKCFKNFSFSIDLVFALTGVFIGLILTFLNLFSPSDQLFLISPIIAIGCSFYISIRNNIQNDNIQLKVSNNFIYTKYLNIIYWLSLSCSLIILYTAVPYNRPLLFFVVIAFCVATIGLDIISCYRINNINLLYTFIKIFLLSLIYRGSAYFISGYPIGSDAWVHSKYIDYFIENHSLTIPANFIDSYLYFPISQLFAVVCKLLSNLTTKESWFIICIVLIISSIFVYILVNLVFKNEQIALLSVLLLNFYDANVQWSVQIIAMSFGIILYIIILFLLFKLTIGTNNKYIYSVLIFLMSFTIIWTHTISAFILLITFFIFLISSFIYNLLYNKKEKLNASMLIILLFIFILLIVKWSDLTGLQNNFFKVNLKYLFDTILFESSYNVSISDNLLSWSNLYTYLGLSITMFFGIIGALYCFSSNKIKLPIFTLLCISFALYVIYYIFPRLGIGNLIPHRWPSFAIISFILFISLGYFIIIKFIKNNVFKIAYVSLTLFLISFLMITNLTTDMDSPIVITSSFEKLIWPDSEVYLFKDVANTYDGTIISDLQTSNRLFNIYLGKTNVDYFKLNNTGNLDKAYLTGKLVIWRQESVTYPVSVMDNNWDAQNVQFLLLGPDFYKYLDSNRNCIIDSGSAKAFL